MVSIILLFSLFYSIIRYSSEIFAGGNPYLTGDWLINYAGGYSGRGLNGQLLLFLSELTNLSLLWLTYCEQILLYFIYVLTIIKILRSVNNRYLWMIALSPVFIMFDFLDTGGAFRKEIIAFTFLGLLVRMNQLGKFTWMHFLPIASLYLLSAFSWEASIIFLIPTLYFTFLLRKDGILSSVNFKIISLYFTVISVLSLLGSFIFQLNSSSEVARAICDTLVQKGLDSKICSGTIYSVSSVSPNIPDTLYSLVIESKFSYYLPVILFALFPFLLNGWLKRRYPLVFCFFLSVLPIFLVGLDWGRWIHIFGTLVTLVWVLETSRSTDLRFFGNSLAKNLLFVFFSLFFTSAWRIPYAGGLPEGIFFGVIARLISWL